MTGLFETRWLYRAHLYLSFYRRGWEDVQMDVADEFEEDIRCLAQRIEEAKMVDTC